MAIAHAKRLHVGAGFFRAPLLVGLEDHFPGLFAVAGGLEQEKREGGHFFGRDDRNHRQAFFAGVGTVDQEIFQDAGHLLASGCPLGERLADVVVLEVEPRHGESPFGKPGHIARRGGKIM